MRTILKIALLLLLSISSMLSFAQNKPTTDYLNLSWKQVSKSMPNEWYGSDEAKNVAENVLLCQKNIGGWAKNKPYHHVLSETEKTTFAKNKGEIGATFDNGATIQELVFLAKVYTKIKDIRYKEAFEKGLNYIFISQYQNGGWPQFYPVRTSSSVNYSADITYNDNAMVNILNFLKDIVETKEDYVALQIDNSEKEKAQTAINKGVECILKTQIIVDGKPTVWCAQHDAVTLAPANARKYELASFSGAESVGIVQFLMAIEKPNQEVINAIDGAIDWFKKHKIEGIRLDREIDKDGKSNLVVVEDKAAPAIWARFYDLETAKPFFCDRDGIKKSTIAEIGFERRNGYSWYTTSPERIISKYEKWQSKWHLK